MLCKLLGLFVIMIIKKTKTKKLKVAFFFKGMTQKWMMVIIEFLNKLTL